MVSLDRFMPGTAWLPPTGPPLPAIGSAKIRRGSARASPEYEANLTTLRLVCGWLLVNGLLMMPGWSRAAATGDSAGGWLSLEAALLVGLVALLPAFRSKRALVALASFIIILSTIIALADLGFRVSLSRPLNLSLDLYLIGTIQQLAVANAGLLRTTVAAVALLLSLTIGPLLVARLLVPGGPGEGSPARRLAPKFGLLMVLTPVFVALLGAATPMAHAGVETPLAMLLHQQSELFRATRAEREAFRAELAGTPDSYAEVPGLLRKLEGTDVLLTFIESYGMAALEDPEFAATILPRLDELASRMAGVGLHLATGALTSPTVGGQSWYAHGTVMSGIWIENQLRYDLLMASERETLVDDFRRAGYRTAALMPAITMSWPEGVRLGYDRTYTLPNIPYAGPPLYWVTMPDQFTWSFLERSIRDATADRPLFVETAMVSSHAPWIPILPILDWDSIGDGSVFAPFRQEGHPPAELWTDIDVLRRDYARSLEYSIQAMTGFAARLVDDGALLIVMGDHQAAPWVTGAVGGDVPVHVIARDPALLEPFLAWGFRSGPLPDPAVRPPRMDSFREWFVRAFSHSDDGRGRPSGEEDS